MNRQNVEKFATLNALKTAVGRPIFSLTFESNITGRIVGYMKYMILGQEKWVVLIETKGSYDVRWNNPITTWPHFEYDAFWFCCKTKPAKGCSLDSITLLE